MNNWLKIALYSFIGIIIGSFLLGILFPSGTPYNHMGNQYMQGGYYGQSPNDMHKMMGNQYGMGKGMGRMNGGMYK